MEIVAETIKIGDLDIESIYLGTTETIKVYIGETLIYEKL